MPVGTAPSFMSRLGSAMPGMVNSLAQNYGNPSMMGAVQGSSSLVGKQRPRGGMQSKGPRVRKGIPPQMGQQMPMPTMPPPNIPPPMMGPGMGIDTGPSMPPPFMGGDISGMFGGMQPRAYGQMGNTGIMGGLFGRFNRLSQPGQTPFGMRY